MVKSKSRLVVVTIGPLYVRLPDPIDPSTGNGTVEDAIMSELMAGGSELGLEVGGAICWREATRAERNGNKFTELG